MARAFSCQSCSDPLERHGHLSKVLVTRAALNVAVSHKSISKTGVVTDNILDFLQLHFKAFRVSFSL